MKITFGKIVWLTLAICFLVLLYPKQITIAPEVELTAFYENGEISKNVDVIRSWNSYADDNGWKINQAITDENGKVKFGKVQKRVPIILERLRYFLPIISIHENNSNVGSITARNPQNHFVYGRIEYTDENCCPTKIIMTKQNLELTNTLFGFGEVDSE